MYTDARGTLNKEKTRITMRMRMKISESYTKVLLDMDRIVRIVVTGGCLKRRGTKGNEEHQ